MTEPKFSPMPTYIGPVTVDPIIVARSTAGKPTVRAAARERQPLDGVDAQALEGALASTERKRDDARARVKELEADLLAIAEAVGIVYEGDGHASVPGPTELIVGAIREMRAAHDRELERKLAELGEQAHGCCDPGPLGEPGPLGPEVLDTEKRRAAEAAARVKDLELALGPILARMVPNGAGYVLDGAISRNLYELARSTLLGPHSVSDDAIDAALERGARERAMASAPTGANPARFRQQPSEESTPERPKDKRCMACAAAGLGHAFPTGDRICPHMPGVVDDYVLSRAIELVDVVRAHKTRETAIRNVALLVDGGFVRRPDANVPRTTEAHRAIEYTARISFAGGPTLSLPCRVHEDDVKALAAIIHGRESALAVVSFEPVAAKHSSTGDDR